MPLADAYELMHYGALALADVEANGIRIDMASLLKEKKTLKRLIQQKEEDFKTSSIYKTWQKTYRNKTNIGSKEQLRKVLFEVLDYKSKGETASRKAKLDADTIIQLEIPELADYQSGEKLKKTLSFLEQIQKETCDGFLHASFNLHLARTYRSSSDMPNFQNFPVRDQDSAKSVRQCFIARDNCQLVEIDYAGIEVRIAACYNKDPVLISYICDKTKDMHRDMAAQCYKIKPEEVSKQARYCGKNMFVFPEFYGSYFMQVAPHLWNGIKQFGLNVAGVSLYERLAQRGITTLGNPGNRNEVEPGTFIHHMKKVEEDFWGKRFKVYAEWKRSWYNSYLRKGYFNLKTGFRVEGVLKRNDVINYPVQGVAFHCLLWSLIKINHKLKKLKMRSRIVGQIHDSIVADVHKNEVDDYMQLAVEIMTKEILTHWKWIIVPLEVEAEVSPLGGTWYDKKGIKL